MHIEWAPLKIPPKRRLQTFAVGLYTITCFTLPFVSIGVVIALLIYGQLWLRTAVLLYVAYSYYDHRSSYSVIAGNAVTLLRNNRFTRNYRDYFPVELVALADLPPNKNYILASFPHGILGTGICINMGFDISKWLETFPKIRPKIATLDQHFYLPFLRDFLRFQGFVSVSKESLTYYLSKTNDPDHVDNRDGFTSNAVAVVIGGAQEALDSHPGNYVITLKNRKGFVKLAIRTGCAIVPSLSFGEVDIYNQINNPPGSLLRRIQIIVKKITRISPLIVVGRGFFNYTIGILPHRRPIVQVVGAPINVTKNSNPNTEYVDEIHKQVMDSLETIFETHKTKYIKDPENAKLVIK